MVSKHCSVTTTFKDGEEEPSKLVVAEKKHPEKVTYTHLYCNSSNSTLLLNTYMHETSD
jgi:hypothetical protein